MFSNLLRNFGFLAVALPLLLVGCGGGEWGAEYAKGQPGTDPAKMWDGSGEWDPEYDDTSLKTVAVLLPLSGANGALGTGIQHAIEIAFFQMQPKNIMVAFHDIGGKDEDKRRVMETVLASSPNMIIGPLFADDVAMMKELKPLEIPALTFTSAKQSLGDGVFSLALLPNQAVEAIVQQINAENHKRVLVLAPDTRTGYMLANNALASAKIYNVEIAGMYFYEEGYADKMKELSEQVAFFQARAENLTAAKEILSDILINQKISAHDKDDVKTQLEEMNKRESLGQAPFDAVLLLGNAADSKTLAAYLRYYDVSTTIPFFGSALWDTDIVYRDSALSGGSYAGLPRISDAFVKLYSDIEGVRPNRFNTIGYDAAMLTIKSLGGKKPVPAYLLDPSGYTGLDGLVRLRPNGENERALHVMQLNGVTWPRIKKRAAKNFIEPIYQTSGYNLGRPGAIKLENQGYDPLDYITLPVGIKGTYKSKSYGESQRAPTSDSMENTYMEVAQPDDNETVIDSDFRPARPSAVDRQMIDEVQMRAN